MPSTFSPNLQLELQATGENAGTWGTKADAVFSQIDLSAGGNLAISVAGNSNVTLSTAQAQYFNHTLTGALTGNIQYIFLGSAGRFVVIDNQTTGAFTVTVLPSGGTGVVAPQGMRTLLYLNPTTNAAQLLFTYSSVAALTATGPVSLADITNLGIRDTSAAFDVTIAATSSVALTAGRTLTLDVANGSWNLQISGNSKINQDLRTTASPTHAGLTITGSAQVGKSAIGTGNTGSIANNATSNILTMITGQPARISVFADANAAANNVKADAFLDGGGTVALANKIQNGTGVDLVVSGTVVQVKNLAGGPASFSWSTS